MSSPACFKATLLCGAALVGAGHAMAAPEGAVFDPASVSVVQNGPVTTIAQATPRAVIDWTGFDVRAQETVAFEQPGAGAAILNRVHSVLGSRIDGVVTAPGRVIIQDANGVMFGGQARVDVGALVATTLHVDEEGFLDTGRLALGGPYDPAATVRNAGTITVGAQGLAALVGPQVANSGIIHARLGTVALAAGAAATIDFHGDGLVQVALTDALTQAPNGAGALVANTGLISADGGAVLLAAEAASAVLRHAINLDGLIEARAADARAGQVILSGGGGLVALDAAARIDVSGETGGRVAVTGDAVRLDSGAMIDARGHVHGGEILVGGSYRGQGALPRARETAIRAGAALDVSAADGAGGSIVVWSDRFTAFDGHALATGARGGFIETSSAGRLVLGEGAFVSTAGLNGLNGTWLIDPDSIAIVSGGGLSASPHAANLAAGVTTIDAATVAAALAFNKVLLVAQNTISVDAPVVVTAPGGSPSGLELIAEGMASDIVVNAPILLNDSNIAMRAGGSIVLGSNPAEADFNARAILDVGAGAIWLQTRDTGSIRQAPNSAIIAQAVALIAGDVDAASFDNYAGVIAGDALNGDFLFNMTNASGAATIGTVADPFEPQSLTGVTQTITTSVGSLTIDSSTAPDPVDQTVVLSQGGALFDTIRFSANPYVPAPPPGLTDSSDYLVRSLSYLLGGTPVSVATETIGGAPAGFAIEAAGGVVAVSPGPSVDGVPVFPNSAWGVDGFANAGPTDPLELGYDPQSQATEELTFHLGGDTDSVTAQLRLFFNPDFDNPYAESATIEFFDTATTPGVVGVNTAAPWPSPRRRCSRPRTASCASMATPILYSPTRLRASG